MFAVTDPHGNPIETPRPDPPDLKIDVSPDNQSYPQIPATGASGSSPAEGEPSEYSEAGEKNGVGEVTPETRSGGRELPSPRITPPPSRQPAGNGNEGYHNKISNQSSTSIDAKMSLSDQRQQSSYNKISNHSTNTNGTDESKQSEGDSQVGRKRAMFAMKSVDTGDSAR